ncbi:MFS transporter [Salaquimonas pukyongi]|uniref:MFS transporter n=1 Tax=Salaquimonas pukyongi TaxID=2712698 RepID=UPI00096B9679|nr:MFS transporter [Salaquimonas pukyongi]
MAVIEAEARENAVARKNAILLAACQSVNGAAAPLSIALGGVVGSYLLAADKSLATAPVTGFTVGAAIMSLPAAILMRNIGRRNGFRIGALVGAAGMLLAVQAIRMQSFWLFAFALLLAGASNAFVQQYRFAAADRGTAEYKPKAISIVLIGGIAAAIIGPQMILHFKDYLQPIPFAGAFLWGTGLFLASILIIQFMAPGHPPKSAEELANKPQRPLLEIMAQPRFIVAVMCGTSAYALMSYVMTAAPLAMIACGFDINDATWGIQWHVMAMFAPSFVTGHLIARFGKERIVAIGLFILVACAIVALNGISLAHFYLALILLGVGWNFGFIGATAMITDTYEPHEKNKAQGANDLVLFGTVALASLMSGISLNNMGWDFINWIVFPIVALCLVSLWWLKGRGKATA